MTLLAASFSAAPLLLPPMELLELLMRRQRQRRRQRRRRLRLVAPRPLPSLLDGQRGT